MRDMVGGVSQLGSTHGSCMNGTLNRLKHNCPQTVPKILYNTLILLHINYSTLLRNLN